MYGSYAALRPCAPHCVWVRVRKRVTGEVKDFLLLYCLSEGKVVNCSRKDKNTVRCTEVVDTTVAGSFPIFDPSPTFTVVIGLKYTKREFVHLDPLYKTRGKLRLGSPLLN